MRVTQDKIPQSFFPSDATISLELGGGDCSPLRSNTAVSADQEGSKHDLTIMQDSQSLFILQ